MPASSVMSTKILESCMTNLTCHPAIDLPLDQLVVLLNRGFEGYTVPVNFSVLTLLSTLARDSVDLSASRVVKHDGTPVGVGLIAKRGWQARLAAMCIVSEFRGQGVGRHLLDHLFDELPEQGIRQLGLEVIASNTPGVALYKGTGFETIRRLISLAHDGKGQAAQLTPAIPTADQLQPADIAKVASHLNGDPHPNLPWQLSGTSLMVSGPPNVAYQWNNAAIVLSDPSLSTLYIRSLLVDPAQRRQGQAQAILAAAMQRHPGKEWTVPALCPEELSGLFEALGFQRGKLAQLQMLKDFH